MSSGASHLEDGRGLLGSRGATPAVQATAFAQHLLTSALFGFLAAVALKLFGPPLATAALVLFAIVMFLAYKGWLNVNWTGVGRMAASFADADGDGRLGLSDAREWAARGTRVLVRFGATSVAGFAAGFVLGFYVF
ncbi:hypothetical protein DFJ74DRAFT_755520 [Hyaloraphidium curvatum]|nr:hypothetical protein DFJ74DRAFT_755520 [Hyaloraphidium curvatum]